MMFASFGYNIQGLFAGDQGLCVLWKGAYDYVLRNTRDMHFFHGTQFKSGQQKR